MRQTKQCLCAYNRPFVAKTESYLYYYCVRSHSIAIVIHQHAPCDHEACTYLNFNVIIQDKSSVKGENENYNVFTLAGFRCGR